MQGIGCTREKMSRLAKYPEVCTAETGDQLWAGDTERW